MGFGMEVTYLLRQQNSPLNYPPFVRLSGQALARGIEEHYNRPDLIVGVATAGHCAGVLVAQEMNFHLHTCARPPKDHGRGNLIEGEVKKGQSE